MKKTKFLLILLCFCLMLPLAAFGKTDTNDKTYTDDKNYYDDSSRERAADTIPEGYDLENTTITFTSPTGYLYASGPIDQIGDAETTDIVYSRIYERNLAVQERLNFIMEFYHPTGTTWQDCGTEIHDAILTMSQAFDIVMSGDNAIIQGKKFNYYHDLNDSNYIDTSEPWWYEDSIMEVSVDNYNYRFLFGDININNLANAGAVFYNKELYEQYLSPSKNRDELYDKVLSGMWTFEEFTRLVKNSHIEKGGDGTNDLHGWIITHAEHPHYFREASGIRMYARDDFGMPIFDFNDDKSVDFALKLYELFYENEGVVNVRYNNDVTEANFTNGQVFFKLEKLGEVLNEDMREMKDDFGILPYPKWDEFQEEYVTLIHNSSTITAIPVSSDIDYANEELSAVIEALCSESYRRVAVAFYETALKAAYNRDDQSAQMIDIITGQHDTVKSTLTKNFAYEYSGSLGGIGNIFGNLIGSRSYNFASTYDSLIGSVDSALRTLIQQYKDGKI